MRYHIFRYYSMVCNGKPKMWTKISHSDFTKKSCKTTASYDFKRHISRDTQIYIQGFLAHDENINMYIYIAKSFFLYVCLTYIKLHFFSDQRYSKIFTKTIFHNDILQRFYHLLAME